MRGFHLKLLIVWLVSLVQVAHLSAADYTFLNITNTSNSRYTTAGEVGGRFSNTSGETVTITHVARWIFRGNTGTQTIRVWGYFGEFITSATVDLNGTPGTWAWAELATPVTVASGYKVYILSVENGVNQWSNPYGGAGWSATRGDVGYMETASNLGTLNAPNLQPNGGEVWNMVYGPVNFRHSTPVKTWTKEGTVYTTNGAYYQIVSAIAHANPGDTIKIPAGTYTWGADGVGLSINKAVTLQGAGMDATIVNQSITAPTGYGSALITLGDGATIRGLSIIGANIYNAVPIMTGAASGWRVSEVKYVMHPGQNPYFLWAQYGATGLIDGCDITGGAGNAELIFARGPADAWNTATPVGTANNIFIEDTIFRGAGYVCDANSNGRVVVRNCTITGGIKVDSHGVWSNGGPQRGARNLEVYRNRWTLTEGAWTAIEIRGGTGMVWGNRSDSDSAANNAWFYLTEYGVFNNNGAFTPNFQTPHDYPIRDQIGRGRYATPDNWTTATSEPIYIWDNLKGGQQWPLSYKAIPAEAISRYRVQTGNPAATFTWEDVIQADRDYFRDVAGFNGTTGMGRGTRAQMDAIRPAKPGVGFWVTDEGDWDRTNPGPDGQLYAWNGSTWTLKYRPYTYPHPLRGDASTPPTSVKIGISKQ